MLAALPNPRFLPHPSCRRTCHLFSTVPTHLYSLIRRELPFMKTSPPRWNMITLIRRLSYRFHLLREMPRAPCLILTKAQDATSNPGLRHRPYAALYRDRRRRHTSVLRLAKVGFWRSFRTWILFHFHPPPSALTAASPVVARARPATTTTVSTF